MVTRKTQATKKSTTRRSKKDVGNEKPQRNQIYQAVEVPEFDPESFVSISQIAFAPTWVPSKEGEEIIVVPRAIRSFDAPSTKSGRATVVECQFVSGDGTFVTGSKKSATKSTVASGDLVSVYVSSAFTAKDQKGVRIVFDDGSGDYQLTEIAEHMIEHIVPMKLRYDGMSKTKKKRNFKAIDISVPRDVAAQFSVGAAAGTLG